ncbi:MAG: hypothetical protein HC803_08020 [Saprospiraceae bacterium]|nr:hypothetical protein [Saprospiraceae bacterium]
MPLVNDNALLGDKLYVQLQVPMADNEETHGTIKQLDEKNYIKTPNGIQKGYIDTIIFNDYRTLIVIAKQKGKAKSDIKLGQSEIKLSVPCTFNNNFQRNLKTEIVTLNSKNSAIDKDGFARLKFKISNKKIGRKSENDLDWNAFTLRIQTNENWDVKGIMLFKERVKKRIWLNA